jgi:glutamate formiminotransferase
LVEVVWCVPNFSEGRRQDVIDAIVGEIKAVEGTRFLDADPDPDHNRVVVSFVGTRAAVAEAAFRAAAKAATLIDLNAHKGEHPRMGATDVVPFVPVSGVTMEQCVELSRQVGRRIGEELKIPVYLYERSATRPERENLADIRKGEFEGLRDRIGSDPSMVPDFGPAHIHPTAGAVAVGARPPLVAFNVNLGTADIQVAKAIARAVRHQTGGFRYVKALGFEIKERGIVQVSMNLVDFTKSPVFRVFEAVRREAARYGVPVLGSEIVGMVPLEALVDVAEWYLQLEAFEKEGQVLERRIWG